MTAIIALSMIVGYAGSHVGIPPAVMFGIVSFCRPHGRVYPPFDAVLLPPPRQGERQMKRIHTIGEFKAAAMNFRDQLRRYEVPTGR